MHIVIIGGTLNGISAALHIRRRNHKTRITILEKSKELGTASCGIAMFLQGRITETEDLQAASPHLLHNIFNINIKLSCNITQIDTANKKIYSEHNPAITYDKLIFALPPLHLRPDIKGILSDNIFTLPSLASAQMVNDYFWGLNARKILILGGGNKGLQTAIAFVTLNAEVTLIEHRQHILRQFDDEFAHLAENILLKHNINLYTSTEVTEFLPHQAILSNQQKIDFDIAIVTTGSHYEILLPIISHLQLGSTGGIIVDKYMQTNIKDIFACGEIIELENSVTGKPYRIHNANLSTQTAKTVADNCFVQTDKLPRIFNNEIITIFDYYAAVCGCNERELQDADIAYQKIYFSGDINENYIQPTENIKIKLIFDYKGKILGAQFWGQSGVFARINIIASMMQQNATVQDLAKFYPAYSPELSRSQDVINIIGKLADEIIAGQIKTVIWEDLPSDAVLLNLGQSKFYNKFEHNFTILDIPFSKLQHYYRHLPRNQIIALTCRNGYSAYLGYCLLRNLGFANIFLLNSPISWS